MDRFKDIGQGAGAEVYKFPEPEVEPGPWDEAPELSKDEFNALSDLDKALHHLPKQNLEFAQWKLERMRSGEDAATSEEIDALQRRVGLVMKIQQRSDYQADEVQREEPKETGIAKAA